MSLEDADERFWQSAAGFLDRWEPKFETPGQDVGIFDPFVSELKLLLDAQFVVVSKIESGRASTLAATPTDDDMSTTSAGMDPCVSTSVQWPTPQSLLASTPLDDDLALSIHVEFGPGDYSNHESQCEQFFGALVAIAGGALGRLELTRLRSQMGSRDREVEWVAKMNSGRELRESAREICAVVQEASQADRVMMLAGKGSHKLIASSNQPKIDRGAEQSQLIERMVDEFNHSPLSKHPGGIVFEVGDPALSTKVSPDLAAFETRQTYLDATAVRRFELIFADKHGREPTGVGTALLVEWFRSPYPGSETWNASFRDHVITAMQKATESGRLTLDALLLPVCELFARRWLTLAVLTLLLFVSALIWVPKRFVITTSGRVIPNARQRVFSPANATVRNVLVKNQQRIDAGEPILELQSDFLDERRRDLERALQNAEAKLAVAMRLRSGGRVGSVDASSGDPVAFNESVLRVEIEGIRSRLELLQRHLDRLNLRSDRSGQVQLPELNSSLQGRPVVHGQHLLDIIDHDGGWHLLLDVDDRDVHHLRHSMQGDPPSVTFATRSSPDRSHGAVLTALSESAAVNSQGRSIVQAKATIGDTDSEHFYAGATVVAKIDCGTRSLGFVWFRNLIQWYKENLAF